MSESPSPVGKFVRAPGIRLRALKREDLPKLWAWYQNPELMRHLVGTFPLGIPRHYYPCFAFERLLGLCLDYLLFALYRQLVFLCAGHDPTLWAERK